MGDYQIAPHRDENSIFLGNVVIWAISDRAVRCVQLCSAKKWPVEMEWLKEKTGHCPIPVYLDETLAELD
jgi:hypothetical protein